MAVVTVDGEVTAGEVFDSMQDLAAAERDATVIAVDIPIDLPETPPRAVDVAA